MTGNDEYDEAMARLIMGIIIVRTTHPGKTIKWSKGGIVALTTDAPPDFIIEGSVDETLLRP